MSETTKAGFPSDEELDRGEAEAQRAAEYHWGEEDDATLRATVVNLTPHAVRLLRRKPDGSVEVLAELPPAAVPARVVSTPGESLDLLAWVPGLELRRVAVLGEVTGLPPRATVREPSGSSSGTTVDVRPERPVKFFLVSALVAQALRGKGRDDVVTPPTREQDFERRNGQIWGVYALEQAPQ